ncbi:MAG: hypothetical protein ACFUZC_05545 [Chthoniobacteraceae bacterium]
MNDASSPKSPIFGGKLAFILGATFLVLFAILTAKALIDRSHRPQLEQIQPQ